MKHLKLYETLYEKPKVGQYVNLTEEENDNDFFKWLSNQILIIANIHIDSIDSRLKDRLIYDIKLLKDTIIPKELQDDYGVYFENDTMDIWFDNFQYWADTKEDIEIKIQAKKYNI